MKNLDLSVDWNGEDESKWSGLLDNQNYTTSWGYDAQGKLTSQTDAKGNIQQTTYNDVGQTESTRLTLQGKDEQVITKLIEYSATGQIELVETGNGIVTKYEYEDETQRLSRKKCYRRLDSDKIVLLQDYNYEYDRVGNILTINNEIDSTIYFQNKAVSPKRKYTYDALYQLISSSGREVNKSNEGYILPSLITPIPKDNSQYVNYIENYEYDRAGNLTKLNHKGASLYSREIYIHERSNRGIWQQDKRYKRVLDIGSYFDRAGNLNYLLTGTPLKWNKRNELSCVDTVERENGNNDNETYFYDGIGMRIVKTYSKKVQNTVQTGRTIYLPGLELRIKKTGDIVTESLQVITSSQFRVLHWEDNTKPEGIGND